MPGFLMMTLFLHPTSLTQGAAFASPDDDSPWSASNGPWRVVGVRKQRLTFGPAGGAGGAGGAGNGGKGGEKEATAEVSVECLPGGGFVVELDDDARYTVSGAGLGVEGELTAVVNGR